MCGICGVIRFDQKFIPNRLLEEMCRVIRHRGPDDQGIYLNNNVGLACRRLSIIDLVTGHQPISNEDETLWLVLNGEIYNYQELRKQLENKGHLFKTNTDTEVLIHLYEESGTECLTKINGMFGFALWDDKQKSLFLGRDRIGKKPLYYYQDARKLIFSSEIKAILLVPEVKRELDKQALNDYLTLGYVPAPRTMFRQISKLLPGHLLTCKQEGQMNVRKYWDLHYEPLLPQKTNLLASEIREMLQESVKLRLRSDVPLGVFLSGGIDSSAVAGLMYTLSRQPMKTYAIGFEGKKDDVKFNAKFNQDLMYARKVAQHFHTDHHELIVQERDATNLLPDLVRQMDEPNSSYGIIPTYLLARFARQQVTVVLSGDGGDELFAGYRRYLLESLIHCYQKIPSPIRFNLFNPLVRTLPFPLPMKKLVHKSSLPSPSDRQLEWLSIFRSEEKEKLFTSGWQEQIVLDSPRELIEEYINRLETKHVQDKLLYMDLKTWFAEESCMRVDKMSMANSLEVRNPFLDYRLVELAFQIPFSYKVRYGCTKYIFKKAIADLLPVEIIRRNKWVLFPPVSTWVRTVLQDFVRETLNETTIKEDGIFNPKYVTELIRLHQDKKQYNLHKIWTLLTYQLWRNAYLNQ